MGAVASTVAASVLGHSDAEKAFRPWWDNIQDHLIYGLIMLGVIAYPKAMLNNSPLWCNQCTITNTTKDICPANQGFGNITDPTGWPGWWVNKQCNLEPEAVPQFLLYFPQVILIVAISLFLVEKFFDIAFKVGDEAKHFYDLLVKLKVLDKKEKHEKDEPASSKLIEPDLSAFKMIDGIGNSNSYYVAYVCTTVTELLVSTGLFAWLYSSASESLLCEEAILGTKITPCNVGGHWYHCAGLPYQFFSIILIASLVLLALYILHTVYVLFWLMPCLSLSVINDVMRKYKGNFKKFAKETDSSENVEDLDSLYYEHMDTQILLALLEMNTGIAPCLKFLCLFDKSLQKNAKIEDLSVKWQSADSEGKSDLEVEFKNSRAVADIFSKIPKASCTYVVEITPEIETKSWVIRKYAENDKKDVEAQSEKILPIKKAEFKKLASGVNYTICVSTQINGHSVAKVSIQTKNEKIEKKFEEDFNN